MTNIAESTFDGGLEGGETLIADDQSTNSQFPISTDTTNNGNVVSLIQVIIANQENLAKRLVTLEKGMQQIYSQLLNVANLCSTNSNFSRPQSEISSVSNMSSTSEPQVLEFKKIDDENSLLEFEKSIGDQNKRMKMVEHFVSLIGEQKGAPQRSIALQLERKMFTETFWARTAWTGGRKADGPRKFAFASHIGVIGFFNDVIRHVCGTPMSDGDLGEFVKSRTRNSGYVRTTNRQTSTRTRIRKRRSPENTNTNLNSDDVNTNLNSDDVSTNLNSGDVDNNLNSDNGNNLGLDGESHNPA